MSTTTHPRTIAQLREHVKTLDDIPTLERMYLQYLRQGSRTKVVTVRNRINKLAGFTKYR